MCCHHARVWNREFALKPAEALKLKGAWVDTTYTSLFVSENHNCIVLYTTFMVVLYLRNNYTFHFKT